MKSDREPIRVLATLLAPTTKVLPSHVRVGVMVGGWMEGVLSSFYATRMHVFKEDLH